MWVVSSYLQDLLYMLRISRLTVVSRKAKEEAASGAPDELETHAREYYTATRVVKIENAITKKP